MIRRLFQALYSRHLAINTAVRQEDEILHQFNEALCILLFGFRGNLSCHHLRDELCSSYIGYMVVARDDHLYLADVYFHDGIFWTG